MGIWKDKIRKNTPTFLNVEQDLAALVERFYTNDNLIKLLLNTDKEITEEQRAQAIKNNIRIVPNVKNITGDEAYVIFVFDNFFPNGENPEHMDKILHIDILCNIDLWNMGNFKLRPYKILGEIDSKLNNQTLGFSYKIKLESVNNVLIDENLSGISATYSITYMNSTDTIDE